MAGDDPPDHATSGVAVHIVTALIAQQRQCLPAKDYIDVTGCEPNFLEGYPEHDGLTLPSHGFLYWDFAAINFTTAKCYLMPVEETALNERFDYIPPGRDSVV